MNTDSNGGFKPRTFRSPDLGRVAALKRHSFRGTQHFQPLPPATGSYPYHLDLTELLDPEEVDAIRANGKLVFHAVGDTGGIMNGMPQQIVANHMDADLADPNTDPARFFYHLGDVVYFYGEVDQYYGQFYEPYSHYGAPIVAIPGNHDGDVNPKVRPHYDSLSSFVDNFCAQTPRMTWEAGDADRDAMTQPNVYWTLDAPFATIVGLYTNVPDGGRVDDDQKAWLVDELASAPTDKALILALHHPVLSLDNHHSGSVRMHELLEEAVTGANRLPDLVLTAHVHNYQRFTRRWEGEDVPFVVAGAGGYHNLHYMTHKLGWPIQLPLDVPPSDDAPGLEAQLVGFKDDRHGYLVLEVDEQEIRGDYFSVPRPQEKWRDPAKNEDSFTLNWKTHTVATRAPGKERQPGLGGVAGIGTARPDRA